MRIQNRFEKWLRLIYHLLFFIFTAIILFVCLLREHVQNCPFSLSISIAQKANFYPEITKNLMFEKCEFCEK